MGCGREAPLVYITFTQGNVEALLDRVRGKLNSYLTSLGKGFAGVIPSPTAWTSVGFFLAILAGVAYWTAGYAGELTGGLLIIASGLFDIVDGAVARVMGRVSKVGAFFDSTLDRVAEVAIYFGILFGGYSPSWWVMLALSLSLLVSYTRAKADSLGTSLSGVGIGERSERLLVLAIASILGYASWGVGIVVLIAGITFLERVYRATTSLR
jgi:archaetidylinositol phosphate synthase